jgi:hypothetical protein
MEIACWSTDMWFQVRYAAISTKNNSFTSLLDVTYFKNCLLNLNAPSCLPQVYKIFTEVPPYTDIERYPVWISFVIPAALNKVYPWRFPVSAGECHNSAVVPPFEFVHTRYLQCLSKVRNFVTSAAETAAINNLRIHHWHSAICSIFCWLKHLTD